MTNYFVIRAHVGATAARDPHENSLSGISEQFTT